MLNILKGNKYRQKIFRNCLILIAISSMVLGCKTLNKVKDADVTILPTESGKVKSNQVVSHSEASIDNATVAEKRAQIQTIDESIKAYEAQIQTIDESIRVHEVQMQRLAEQIPLSEIPSIASHSDEVSAGFSTFNSVDETTLSLDSNAIKSNELVNHSEASIGSSVIFEKRAEILNLEKTIRAREAQIETIDESIMAREAQLLLLVDQIQIGSVEQILRLTEENPTASGKLLPISPSDDN
jgi:hypothetical protein